MHLNMSPNAAAFQVELNKLNQDFQKTLGSLRGGRHWSPCTMRSHIWRAVTI